MHRSGEGLNDNFRTVVIAIPEDMKLKTIPAKILPATWQNIKIYPICQSLGDEWYRKKTTAVLKVPSSIVPDEFNYVINTRHPDFSKISIIHTEKFLFDPRIKAAIDKDRQ